MLHSTVELSSVDLERWDGGGGGREVQEGGDTGVHTADYFTVQPKLTQHCKETI